MASLPTFEEGIAELRVRLNWRGAPVLQMRKVLWRCRFVSPGRERVGLAQWRDVGRTDAMEAGAALAAMSRRAAEYMLKDVASEKPPC